MIEDVLLGVGGGQTVVDLRLFAGALMTDEARPFQRKCLRMGESCNCSRYNVATSYRECRASRPAMPKKYQKVCLGPVGQECQKSAEKVEKVPKKSLFGTFSALLRLSTLFGTPGRQARDDLFETFLALRARRAWHSLQLVATNRKESLRVCFYNASNMTPPYACLPGLSVVNPCQVGSVNRDVVLGV